MNQEKSAQTNIQSEIQAGLKAQQTGNLSLAESIYRNILTEEPSNFDATHLLGVLCILNHRHAEAESHLRKATEINPNHPTAYYNLGLCLDNLGKKSDAIDAYSKAIQLNPNDFRALSNRAKTLRELGNPQQSVIDCEKALALKPDYARAYQNLGVALRDLRRPTEALASYVKALNFDPDLTDALYSLGNTLIELKQYDSAISPLTKLLTKHPDHPYALGSFFNAKLHGCDWHDYEKLSQVITARVRLGLEAEVPFSFLAFSKSVSDQFICSINFTKHKYPPKSPIHSGEIYQHTKPRIAYLSADFHNHATSYLMAGLFEAHDHEKFEIIAISFGPDTPDEMRQKLLPCFTQFIDVNAMTDNQVANLIKELEIDIAVDLKGFTGDSRTGIFAYKAAPIQINYLGYPGTMGASYMDYIIADPHVIPESDRDYYSEKIIYLPDTYQANDSQRKIADTLISRKEAGLPEHGFVFCCFNNNYKITPEIFDIWMRLLNNNENSVLWLLDDNPTAVKNLKKEAEARGINASRLVFAERVMVAEHLARQRLADLFLDTLPYNAHTTASDALWAGLPVLTYKGDCFASRVASSLLSAVGMDELITESLEEYEHLASKLAKDKILLDQLKQKLNRNIKTKPLFDTGRFCRHLESAYLTAWQIQQNGKPAEHIFVQAESAKD